MPPFERRSSHLALVTLLLGLQAGLGPAAFGQVQVGPDDDAEAAINALGPGDELILRGGDYVLDERFSFALAGTEAAPIVIRAADGERPHLHRPTADQNIIDIDNAEHVVLRGIEFSGGSAGIRISSARHLTIEDCEIHDTSDVAIRANDGGTYESLRILRNHIHHTNGTGEGMYLGCNNDGCRVVNSVIEGNYVHHTNQDTVEQGDGIELKEGSYGNIIRDNVIHDTNYPCILTYSVVGNGPPNLIERNVMWRCGDHAIQSAADATIRNNIILGANADGIAMQSHQSGRPSNLVVVHNTVINDGDAISVRDISGSVVIANNAAYSESGAAVRVGGGDTAELVLAGNVGVGGVSGADDGVSSGAIDADFVAGSYTGRPPIDLFPAPGGALVGSGDAAHTVTEDFNGTERGQDVDVGAYAFDAAGNPGWSIGEAFKDEMVPPSDGGDDVEPAPGDDVGTEPSGDVVEPAPDDDVGTEPDGGEPADGGDELSRDGPSPSGAAGDDGGGCTCQSASLSPSLIATGALSLLGLRRRRP